MRHTPDIEVTLPEEGQLVMIRVGGCLRPRYYQVRGRWYCLDDLDRWRMNTSPYWEEDRSWYLKMEQVEGWVPVDQDAPLEAT